jgi:hypothetical protein
MSLLGTDLFQWLVDLVDTDHRDYSSTAHACLFKSSSPAKVFFICPEKRGMDYLDDWNSAKDSLGSPRPELDSVILLSRPADWPTDVHSMWLERMDGRRPWLDIDFEPVKRRTFPVWVLHHDVADLSD